MIEEIKYRQAFTLEDGSIQWHYWGYLNTDTRGLPVFINPIGAVDWDKRPSDLFSGRRDKNNIDIYAEDILLYTRKKWHCPGHPQHNKDLKNRVHVYWNKKEQALWTDMYDDKRCYSSGSFSFKDERADENIIEIIGNTRVNPKLLEK